MEINRVNVAWQGWPGAPGVSTFYVQDMGPTAVDGISSFFGALIGILPSGLTITVPSTGDVIEDTTGQIVSSWSATPATPVRTGTGPGVYSGVSGAVIHWLTSGVVRGRRVRGRTFIVPIVGSAYDAQGSLSTAALTTLQGAANGLDAAVAGLTVWSRPTGFASGSNHVVTGTRVPDLAVTLRTRRT